VFAFQNHQCHSNSKQSKNETIAVQTGCSHATFIHLPSQANQLLQCHLM